MTKLLGILKTVKTVFLQIVFPLAVWARDENGFVIKDKDGKPQPAKIATLTARILSLGFSAFAVTNIAGIQTDKIIAFLTNMIYLLF